MVEQLHPGVSASRARVCLFDFDGTLSLLRSGWMDVMVPMMVEILADLKTNETEGELRAEVEDYVGRLTGKQTVYQMIELADRIRARGGTPLDPLDYKRLYLARLDEKTGSRMEELRQGGSPEKYLVPGARSWLESLQARGLKLYLASGTDQEYMRAEAGLLDLSRYFDGGVYGALDDYRSFSKRILIQRLIAGGQYRGEELLCFGDGYVEIENVKEAGGIAVGVATAEPECRAVDEWKRQRLAGAGADYIIPNYLCQERLLASLFCDGKQIPGI